MSDLQVPSRPLNLAAYYLHDRAKASPDRRALIVDAPGAEARTYDYRDVSQEAARYGNVFAQYGLDIEDRIIILLPDGLPWVAAFFGALGIGATTIFLNPQISDEAIAFYVEDSRARAIVTTAEIAARCPASSPFVRHIIAVDGPTFLTARENAPTSPELAATTEEDFAIWLYSSGSTGAPKAAVHRAKDFVYNTEHYAAQVLQLKGDDITLSVPKLFFGYATGTNLLFPFAVGATAVLFADKPTPERLFELIERHKTTVLVNVPTLIAQMVDAGAKSRLPSLRLVSSAGEALPPPLYERWRQAFDAPILDGIGSAEMFHVFISNRVDDVKPGSLGKLVEGYEAKIVADDGTLCGPGEVGTLWVGGPSAAAFYWARAEQSREVLRGRWVVTGDKFSRDSDGYFYYQGRASDVVKVGGRWVAPQEIEDALTQHDEVIEAGVAFFEDGGLTKPMAFVVPKGGSSNDEALSAALSKHVANTTAPYKAPRFIEFVPRLPRGDRDKLSRPELKKMAVDAARRRGITT